MRPPVLSPGLDDRQPFDVRAVDGAFTAMVAAINRLAGVEQLRFSAAQAPSPLMPLEGGEFGGAIAAPAIYIVRSGLPNARLLTASDLPTTTAVGGVRKIPLLASERVDGETGAVTAETVDDFHVRVSVLLCKLRAAGYLSAV